MLKYSREVLVQFWPLSLSRNAPLSEREGPSLSESGALRDRERGQNWTREVSMIVLVAVECIDCS